MNEKQNSDHVHTIRVSGRLKTTSNTVVDPDDDTQHFHRINGGKTSSDEFGGGHTHTYRGNRTSPPLAMGD